MYICLGYAEIIYACSLKCIKETRASSTCNCKIAYLKEIAFHFPFKRICTASYRSTYLAPKINVLLEHVVARKAGCICIDRIQLRLILDKLIVVVRRDSSQAVHLVCCCDRYRAVLVSDMRIAAVGSRFRMENDGICRCYVRRIEESNMRTVYLDTRRIDLAHINDIGFQRGSRVER